MRKNDVLVNLFEFDILKKLTLVEKDAYLLLLLLQYGINNISLWENTSYV